MAETVPENNKLVQAWLKLEDYFKIQENNLNNADDEAIKTLDKQDALIKQKKIALIAKNRAKGQSDRKKELLASNKHLKKFFHPDER